MRPSPITSLLLSSFLLLSGCAISKYNRMHGDNWRLQESDLVHIPGASGVVKYKASIDVLKNHLTGLLVVKKTDSLATRIVFITELGMKMFDFEARNNTINAVYVFDPLNKPALIEALKRNFNNMLLLNANGLAGKYRYENHVIYNINRDKHANFYTINSRDSSGVSLQETFYKNRKESRIDYHYSTQTRTYTQITCKQYGLVKFYFELNAIPPTND